MFQRSLRAGIEYSDLVDEMRQRMFDAFDAAGVYTFEIAQTLGVTALPDDRAELLFWSFADAPHRVVFTGVSDTDLHLLGMAFRRSCLDPLTITMTAPPVERGIVELPASKIFGPRPR